MKFLSILFFLFFFLATTLSSWAGVTVDFGGQLRFRPETRDNADFNDGTKDEKEFFGQRIRLNATIKGDDSVSGFLQIQDARKWGSVSNVGSSVNEDGDHENLDLFQAYIKVEKLFSSDLQLKIGRQTLVYGDQRLFGHLGWKDEARSFDAIKLSSNTESHAVDLFYAKLKENDGTAFDADQDLLGIYNVLKMVPDHPIDLYYFLWADGSNNRRIHTFGTRIQGKVSSLDYTAEAVKQVGVWNTTPTYQYHQAFAFALKAGYTLPVAGIRIGVEYDRGSGGESGAGLHENFVFPFHTNHAHYGYMDYFSWGNMSDLKFSVKTAPIEKTTFQLDYHHFTLVNKKGDWLNVVGTGNTAGMAGNNSYKEDQAGSEIDLTVKYIFTKQLKSVVGYSLFFPGDAVKERTGNDDISRWGYLMMIYTF